MAGGAGTATASIADILMQNKDFQKAVEEIKQCKVAAQDLVHLSINEICKAARFHAENMSAVDRAKLRIVIAALRENIESCIPQDELDQTLELLQSEKSMKESEKSEIKRLTDELKAFIDGAIEPMNELICHIDEIGPRHRKLESQDSSVRFIHEVKKAGQFVERFIRIMLTGSADEQTNLTLEPLRNALRLAAGAGQIGAEVASAAARGIAGRVLGIVGSSVFTALDIGMLAYYSYQVHQARSGHHTKKADPIVSQIEVFERLHMEADRYLCQCWL